jgi:hypothetical protein
MPNHVGINTGSDAARSSCQHATTPYWTSAVVTSASAEGLELRLHGQTGLRSGRIAASLLLQPDVGDQIVAFVDEQERLWVTQILKLSVFSRATPRLTVSGAESLQFEAPNLMFHAGNAVDIRSHSLQATADAIAVKAKTTAVIADRAWLSMHQIHTAVHFLHTVALNVIQRARTRVVHVEKTDILEAERIEISAECSLDLDGNNVRIEATGPLCLDGKRVLVG